MYESVQVHDPPHTFIMCRALVHVFQYVPAYDLHEKRCKFLAIDV